MYKIHSRGAENSSIQAKKTRMIKGQTNLVSPTCFWIYKKINTLASHKKSCFFFHCEKIFLFFWNFLSSQTEKLLSFSFTARKFSCSFEIFSAPKQKNYSVCLSLRENFPVLLKFSQLPNRKTSQSVLKNFSICFSLWENFAVVNLLNNFQLPRTDLESFILRWHFQKEKHLQSEIQIT